MRNWHRTLALCFLLSLPRAEGLAQDGQGGDSWAGLAAEMGQYREIPADGSGGYIHRVVARAGSSAIATSYLAGDLADRQTKQRRIFAEFERICASSAGTIRDPGQAGHSRTRTNLTGEQIFFHLGERDRDNAGILICDRQGAAIGAIIAVHEIYPQWSGVILLDPAIVVPDAIVEAEQRAASERRWREHQEWQRTVGEGEMTGCGRILTARVDIVELADRSTGQARWVERSELNQPHEGCR